MNMFQDPLQTYEIVVVIFAVGFLITTLEYLFLNPEFGGNGIYAWRVHRLEWRRDLRTGMLGRVLDQLFCKQGITALMCLRLVCLLVILMAPLGSLAFTIALTGIVVITLISNAGHMYGGDGSDQMFAILAVVLLLCVHPWSTSFQLTAGLWFIATQSVLSYCAAGIAKVASAQWRSGEAVYRIFNTGSYGVGFVGQFLSSHQRMSYLLSAGVMVFETLFPLCLVLPFEFTLIFLGWGFLFHLLNAMIMGLNTFLAAFVATYPAVIFVSNQIRDVWQ